MPILPKRAYRITVGNTILTEHAMSFSITKTDTKDPNTATITLWNLSPETRKAFLPTKKGQKVGLTLEAGYGDKLFLMFKGKISRVSTIKDGADWTSTIEVSDGAVENALRQAIHIAPGAKVEEVAEQIIKKMGLAPEASLLKQLVAKFQEGGGVKGLVSFVKGFSLSGFLMDDLTDLGKDLGLALSVQNEQVIAFEAKKGVNKIADIVVDLDHGLIGSPEIGDKGEVTCAMFLLPWVRPGDPVKVKSTWVTGRYRVKSLTQTGQNRQGEWKTSMTMEPIT